MFKKLGNWWRAIDGKKTLTGLVVTAVGGIMYLNPVTAIYATKVLYLGAGTMAGGLIHKGYKFNKKANEATKDLK